ncbi:MAG: DUF192 domain-containing protein [Kofleriaceae bacterium]
MRFALVVCLAACSSAKKPDDARPIPTQAEAAAVAPGAKVWLTGPEGEIPVTVEVVATRPKITKGLMYREHLPVDAGMLFLMEAMEPKEIDHAFWMQNTLIPLDMLFINKAMIVVGIVENAEPRTETLRRVGEPSFYVLEVNGGWTAKKRIATGAKVRFEGVPGVSP